MDATGGLAFGWRGRVARGVASGGKSAGGDGVGRLKDSVGGLEKAFHGLLMDGAAWGSEESVRRECGSAGGGIVDDGKGVDDAGCVAMAKEANVGGVVDMGGGFDVAGNAV